MFPVVVDKKQQKIIDTHPLNPMCNWYPSLCKMEDGKNLFVNIANSKKKVNNNKLIIQFNTNKLFRRTGIAS